MKRVKNILNQKRMVLYFVLAIGAPSLVLGFLAFRGIQNDQALIEKQNRERAEEFGNQIILAVGQYISGIEDAFIQAVLPRRIPETEFFSDSILEEFNSYNPIVAGIFILDPQGEMKILKSGLQYLPNGSVDPLDEEESIEDKILLENGWIHEFQNRDFNKALLYYKSISPKLSRKLSSAKALNSIARLQKKLNLLDDAITTYESITDQFPLQYIGGSLPVALAAKRELSQLYLQLHDPLKSAQICAEIYRDLRDRRWLLEERVYSLFRQSTDQLFDSLHILKDPAWKELGEEIEILKNDLNSLQIQTITLLTYKNNVEGFLQGHLNRVTNSSSFNTYRFEQEISGKSNFLSITVNRTGASYGLLFDSDQLQKNVVTPRLKESFAGIIWAWQLRNQEDMILSESEMGSVEAVLTRLSFPSQLPGWSLLLFTEPSGIMQSFLQSGQSMYFYIFIFIALALVFGLIFTLQTINHELEITKMKSNFIDTVSHEFKSPLTSIRQMVEMLDTGRVPTRSRRKDYYKIMHHQTERLTHLVENIMNFSILEKGKRKFYFELVDIADFVMNIRKEFNDVIVRNQIHLNIKVQNSMPKVYVDKESMEQVFYNLVDNAIKYSGDSDKIDVDIKSKNDSLFIQVTDYGIGIPQNDRQKIFERFFRADNHQSLNIKGSGIGLNIVKEIVHAHQGQITLESDQGKGSSFQVVIPLQQN